MWPSYDVRNQGILCVNVTKIYVSEGVTFYYDNDFKVIVCALLNICLIRCVRGVVNISA